MKFSLRKTLVTAALAASIPGALFASSTTSPGAQLISKVGQGKIKIIKQFQATKNLDGFVIEPTSGNQQKTIVYTSSNGDYLFIGNLINKDGKNLSQQYFQKYINSAEAPKIFTAASKTAWIAQGSKTAPHQAYIMVEPNCIACHMLYEKLQPAIKAGKLSVRWIFVAFLKSNSQAKAAAILQAAHPDKAFAYDEAHFNTKTEEGGITPAKTIDSSTKKKIETNMAFMSKAGFAGTPAIVYKTTSGSYKVMRGFDPQLDAKQLISNMGQSFKS